MDVSCSILWAVTVVLLGVSKAAAAGEKCWVTLHEVFHAACPKDVC